MPDRRASAPEHRNTRHLTTADQSTAAGQPHASTRLYGAIMSVGTPDRALPLPGDRCQHCEGEGWSWEPAAVTAPAQEPAWQSCRPCNQTGLRHWANKSPRRPQPSRDPDNEIGDAVDLFQFLVSQTGEAPAISKPDTWRSIGIDAQFSDQRIVRFRQVKCRVGIAIYVLQARVIQELLPIRTTPEDISHRAIELMGEASSAG
jgi:hypothetical protein